MAKAPADLKSLAHAHTAMEVNVLYGVARSAKAPLIGKKVGGLDPTPFSRDQNRAGTGTGYCPHFRAASQSVYSSCERTNLF